MESVGNCALKCSQMSGEKDNKIAVLCQIRENKIFFFFFFFLLSYCSGPEHNVLILLEREKEPESKTGDRDISGTRNRNHCYSGFKSEAFKPGAESLFKQSGRFSTYAVNCRDHN